MVLSSSSDGTLPAELHWPSTTSAGVVITPNDMICFRSVTFFDFVLEAERLRGLFRGPQGVALGAAGSEDL